MVLEKIKRQPQGLAPKRRVASIHELPRASVLRNQATYVYATTCMSIRLVLRAAASPSDESTDLTGSEGKPLLKVSVVGLTRQPCTSKAPLLCTKVNFRQRILGNSRQEEGPELLLEAPTSCGSCLFSRRQL
jgi:hypothetical protein